MGYSVAVTMQSKKAFEQMRAFLDQHFRPWSEVSKAYADDSDPDLRSNPDFDATRYVCYGSELDYDKGVTKIGFNCTTSNHIMFCYLRWMALKLGRKRPFKKKFDIVVSVPYTVYDGHDGWPVLQRRFWERGCPDKAKFCLVDDVGYQPETRWWTRSYPGMKGLDQATLKYCRHQDKMMTIKDRLILEELQRLEYVWDLTHGGIAPLCPLCKNGLGSERDNLCGPCFSTRYPNAT